MVFPTGVARDILMTVPTAVGLRISNGGSTVSSTQHLPDEFAFELQLADGTPLPPERVRCYRAGDTHDQTVKSVGMRCDKPIDSEKLSSWLGDLVRTRGTDIFRMKAIVEIAGDDHRWVFQRVHMLVRAERDRPWGDEKRRSELVFIGRELDRAALEAGFETTRA